MVLTVINCGIPKWSVLGSFLYLLYKNNKVHHFADNNILCLSNYIKKLNKLVNADLEHLVNWLNAHKTSINAKKLK